MGHRPGSRRLAELISQTRALLEPLSSALEGPFGDGDLVAGRRRGRGHQDGTEVGSAGKDILHVRDGRFVEYWVASVTRRTL